MSNPQMCIDGHAGLVRSPDGLRCEYCGFYRADGDDGLPSPVGDQVLHIDRRLLTPWRRWLVDRWVTKAFGDDVVLEGTQEALTYYLAAPEASQGF